jgi:outer membrane protein insertion porin family
MAVGFLCPVLAQEAPWYLNGRITDIEFEGLENINPRDLDGVKRPFIGQAFTNALYLDLQSRLYALNYFDTFDTMLEPGGDGEVIIRFAVKEKPLILSVVFLGNSSVPSRELTEVIIAKRDDILSNARLRSDAQAIQNLYVSKGFSDARVTWTAEPDSEVNKVRVVFEITEGAQTRVENILFSGNQFASSRVLARLLSTKSKGLFNSGIFEESKLAADREAILRYYNDRGYIDARIVDVNREAAQDPKGQNLLTLTFYIEEGAQYTFGGFTFEGNELYGAEELQALIRSETGALLNRSLLEEDLSRVADIYHNDGYIFNVIYPEEIRSTERNQIGFIVHIREYGRAHIENIIIRGNTKTQDHVILRELPLEVGDVFSKDRIYQGLNNLNNLQFFSSFIPDTPQGSADGLMDLIITVEEGKTIDLNFGATFNIEAGSFPILGFLRVADRNFRGLGQEIAGSAEFSSKTQRLNFSFTERWLRGRRWSAGVELSFAHNVVENVTQDILYPIFSGTVDDDPQMVPDPYDGHWVDSSTGADWAASHGGSPSDAEIKAGQAVTDYVYALSNGAVIPSGYLMTYETMEAALGGNTGYTFYTNYGRVGLSGGLSFGISRTTYDDVIYRPYNPNIRNEHNQFSLINRLTFRTTYDTRDVIYNPTRGIFLSETWTYAGGIIGGSRNYNRSATTFEFFHKLFEIEVSETWSWRMVFAFNTSLSFIFQQFGWSSSGWGRTLNATQSDLLYIDGMISARGWDPIYNGRVLWDNWIELRNPLVANIVSFNLFLSGTGIWSDLASFREELSLSDFLFSTGFGLQLDMPNFPMGLYLVKRFKIQDNQIAWQPGDLFKTSSSTSGMQIVLSFSFNYF